VTNRSRLIAAAALSLTLSYPAFGADSATQPSAASDEIKAIRARLNELEARQKQEEQLRHQAERKLEEKIAADELGATAAEHDQFIAAEGFTAGYTDGRFIIQSADGNFLLHPWIHFQGRGIVNYREGFQGSSKNPEDETNSGFEIRRLRLGFDGNMFSPDFTYFFDWNTVRTSANATVSGATPATKGGTVTVSNNSAGTMVLQQAWAKYHIPASPFFVKFGQIKDPVLHEQIVDPRFQQGAERSITADIFTNGDDFTEAADLIYDPDTFIRAEAALNHGMRSANTNFYSYPDNGSYNAYDYGVAGRVEYKVMGRWKDYQQVGAVNTKEPLLVFGTAGDYSERGHDGQLVAGVDGMYADQQGLSLYGSFLDRYTTHNFGYYQQSASGATILAGNPAVAGKSTNEYSVIAEGGYLFNQHMEPFVRYEFIHLQGSPAGSHNWVQAITGGVNYYFHGYSVKVTGEVIWLPEGLPYDDTPNDVLANSNGKTELSFVAQIQLIL
jgi:hypothetical protein